MPWLEAGGVDQYEGTLRQRAMNGPPLPNEHRAAGATCSCGWCEPPELTA